MDCSAVDSKASMAEQGSSKEGIAARSRATPAMQGTGKKSRARVVISVRGISKPAGQRKAEDCCGDHG